MIIMMGEAWLMNQCEQKVSKEPGVVHKTIIAPEIWDYMCFRMHVFAHVITNMG